MAPDRYNIRVYGICLNEKGQVLLTDERRGGILMTKFPGGGHHLGEGLTDTLKREFREECDTEIAPLGLFYANDFLQVSAFNPREQLISIYYLAQLVEDLRVPTVGAAFAFGSDEGDEQAFRWTDIHALEVDDFRFPVDKVVVQKIKENAAALLALAQY